MKLLYKNKFTENQGWSTGYIVSETLETDYVDITSIENWKLHANDVNLDYKALRMEIFNLVWEKMQNDPANFPLLNPEEQKIAAEYFCVPFVLRELIYTIDEQVEFGRIFDEKSTESRVKRFKQVRAELYNRLIYDNVVELLSECKLLVDAYFDGIEGSLEGDGVGLFDYIESRPNTIYANSGLLNKDYEVLGLDTVQALSEKIMTILKKGIY